MSDGHGTTDTGELAPDAPEDFPDGARRALVVLLTNRFITRTRNRAVWDILRGYEEEIRGRLADLYLTLEIDHDHGVAFKRQIYCIPATKTLGCSLLAVRKVCNADLDHCRYVADAPSISMRNPQL